MRENRLILAAAVAFLLGCGSAPTHADDQKPDDKKDEKKDDKKDDKAPADKKDEKAPEKKADKKPEKHFVATVTDASAEPFKIDDAELLVPQVSLLGGESFEHKKSFVVKRGAAEIEVPFEEISKVNFGVSRDDRLEVKIEFKAADKAEKTLDGTVKSNLQLGGRYQQRQLVTKMKLRELKSLALEEAKGQ